MERFFWGTPQTQSWCWWTSCCHCRCCTPKWLLWVTDIFMVLPQLWLLNFVCQIVIVIVVEVVTNGCRGRTPPPRGSRRKPLFAHFGVCWVSAMLRLVCAILSGNASVDFCLSCVPLYFQEIEWAKCRNIPSGVKAFCLAICKFVRFGGGSHSAEALGPLGTMVSQNDSSKEGAAHGPATLLTLDYLSCCGARFGVWKMVSFSVFVWDVWGINPLFRPLGPSDLSSCWFWLFCFFSLFAQGRYRRDDFLGRPWLDLGKWLAWSDCWCFFFCFAFVLVLG